MSLWSVGVFCTTLCRSVYAAEGKSKSELKKQPIARPELRPQLRWARPDNQNASADTVQALRGLFENHGHKLNFAKRDLTNLLEQAMPRKLGSLFPFRRVHKVSDQLFFENFGSKGFLVGEVNPRVPPILSGTDTAEWLELYSRETLPRAREFTPPLPVLQGLKGLGTQSPWAPEIFSTTWAQQFETAGSIIEHGGLRCMNNTSGKKNYQNLAEPAAHFRCGTPLKTLSAETSLPIQLPRKIGSAAAAAAAAVNPPAAPPACVAMGRQASQSLELLGDEKSGHCLLWRSSRDERFYQKGMTSKLICLNARHKSFQRTRFNSVVSVLPSERQDVIHILESEDDMLTSYRLSLATLSVAKEEISVPSGQNLRATTFPTQKTGLYACQQQTPQTDSPLFANPESLGAGTDWIYVDNAIYSGLRATRPETDTAWRIRESRDGVIEAERLSWSQLQYDHPSVTNDRPFACVVAREIDARCGIRVLQSAIQLSEEWLSGDFDRNDVPPAVQLATTLLIGQSLEKVMIALPDWSLRGETLQLLRLYSQKVKQLLNNKAFERSGIALTREASDFPAAQKYLDIPADSPDYTAVKKLLSSSVDFWALLNQKSL